MYTVWFQCREKDWAFLTEVDYKVSYDGVIATPHIVVGDF